MTADELRAIQGRVVAGESSMSDEAGKLGMRHTNLRREMAKAGLPPLVGGATVAARRRYFAAQGDQPVVIPGEELKAQRLALALGLSQDAFGMRHGIPQWRISKMERNEQPVKLTRSQADAAPAAPPEPEPELDYCPRCLCWIAAGICGCREAA